MIDMDLEEFDMENRRAGMSLRERLDALEPHLVAFAVMPESLLQDLDNLVLDEASESENTDD